MDAAKYDYVIVGAGSAGCVLANRLSRDPMTRVLLLEAGPKDRNPWLKIPAGRAACRHQSEASTWGYTSEEEPGLNNRKVIWPRGKTLGGTSSINGHVYMRGTSADYDGWRDLGNSGWGWSDVLPYFKRSERHFARRQCAARRRRRTGCLAVVRTASGIRGLWSRPRSMPAWCAMTTSTVRPQEGVGYLHFMIRDGVRASTAAAFLRPVLKRRNLEVVTNALVERILLDGNNATGVRYSVNGQSVEARARETIVSGGTINSPQLLMLSGIGPSDQLRSLGIEVKHELNGVGKNLHDHLYAHCLASVEPSFSINKIVASNWRMLPDVLRYLVSRRGLLTSAAAQVGLFVRTDPGLATPDLQIQMRPFSMISKDGMYTAESAPAVTASCGLLQPHSTGSMSLRSSSPRDAAKDGCKLSDRRARSCSHDRGHAAAAADIRNVAVRRAFPGRGVSRPGL